MSILYGITVNDKVTSVRAGADICTCRHVHVHMLAGTDKIFTPTKIVQQLVVWGKLDIWPKF